MDIDSLIKAIPNWEQEYLANPDNKLSNREKEILK